MSAKPPDCVFDRDLTLEDGGPDGESVGEFSERWFIDRAMHGGHVMAAMVRGVEHAVDDPARPLRSITVHYLQPALAGPFRITTRIERSGRSLTSVSAQLHQAHGIVTNCVAALGAAWESYEWDHSVMPDVAAPEDCPDLWDGAERTTNSHHQWTYRRAMGPAMMSGVLFDGSMTAMHSGGWVRLAEPRPVDAALAACLTDTWVPAPFTHIDADHRAMFPTIDLTVHLLDPLPLPGDTGADPCLVWHRIDTSRGGFAQQDTEVWTRSGRLIARGRQQALFIPVRPRPG